MPQYRTSFLSITIVAVLCITPSLTRAAPVAGLKAVKSSDYSNVSQRIRIIQRKLQTAGFQPGIADGIFGPRTSRAISHYQKKHGLPRSGYPDRQFLKDLYNRVPDKPK
jgi:peptidoglycan hydrolase-like protein with peptidoglycan-binding domain